MGEGEGEERGEGEGEREWERGERENKRKRKNYLSPNRYIQDPLLQTHFCSGQELWKQQKTQQRWQCQLRDKLSLSPSSNRQIDGKKRGKRGVCGHK